MKAIRLIAFCLVGMGAFGVFADAANALIAFSTQGDFYADGAPVLDGEWYALVWSSDGCFEGLNLDLTPVDPQDLVVACAPLAKGGRCPLTVFQVDSCSAYYKTMGEYAVILLDTRDATKTGVSCAMAGRPPFVQAAVLSQSYTAASSFAGAASPKGSAGSVWAESVVDCSAADFKPARIASLEARGARVTLSIADMLPGVRYNVRMGASPDALESYALDVPATLQSGDEVVFNVKEQAANFFQVVREPLSRK